MITIAAEAGVSIFQKPQTSGERTIELTEKIHLNIPRTSKEIRLWVPIPTNDSYQMTKLLGIESPFSYTTMQDPDFKNRFLYFEQKEIPQKDGVEIKIRYQITRREYRSLQKKREQSLLEDSNQQSISEYLKPRGLEVIDDQIREIAKKTTSGIHDPLEQAKAIYEYVLGFMQYDKSGTGWGRGDSTYACRVGKGNCTDFHSLFIVLARASGIPARFNMGFSLPQDQEGEPAGAYHCWAEFYIEKIGWIPVDISEAWKHPEKATYFFGSLDEDRVLLTIGREIKLLGAQNGSPLNYVSKPYVEMNGEPFYDFKLERRYKKIKTKEEHPR